MNDPYYVKYLKYKTKYLHLKQKGGQPSWLQKFLARLTNFSQQITKSYGKNWCLVGSASVVFLLWKIVNSTLFDDSVKQTAISYLSQLDKPKDFDILIATGIKGVPETRSIIGYIRTKDPQERSATYQYIGGEFGNSFDVIFIQSLNSKNISIDGINIRYPPSLRDEYKDNLSEPDRLAKRAQDQIKYDAMKFIVDGNYYEKLDQTIRMSPRLTFTMRKLNFDEL